MFSVMSTTHLDVTELRATLESQGLPWEVSYHPTSRSTQVDAHGLIATHGAGHWLVIAEVQEAGRGRGGRRWLTDAGDLAATWTLPLDVAPERYAKLSLLGGLIAAEAIREVLGIAVGVKWPNDLYKDGQKCGGCLGELIATSTQPVACLGIGINLVAKDVGQLGEAPKYPVTSLAVEDSRKVREGLLVAISRMLYERATWVRPEHDTAFAAWWESRNVMGTAPIRVTMPGDVVITGMPLGIGAHGELLLIDGAGKTHTITAGDVHL